MMKTINEIWNYLLSTGTFGVIVAFAWMYVRPVLEQKKLHAKTLQEKEMLDVTEKLADQAVTSLAGNNDITGHEKFKIATGLVANTLADKGFKVDDKVVDHVVPHTVHDGPVALGHPHGALEFDAVVQLTRISGVTAQVQRPPAVHIVDPVGL